MVSRISMCYLEGSGWETDLRTWSQKASRLKRKHMCKRHPKVIPRSPQSDPKWSNCLTRSHKVSQGLTRSRKVPKGLTRPHKASQGLTRSHKVSQGLTRAHMRYIFSIKASRDHCHLCGTGASALNEENLIEFRHGARVIHINSGSMLSRSLVHKLAPRC